VKCIVVTRVCVCVYLSLASVSHYCTDLDVTWRNVTRISLTLLHGPGCNLEECYRACRQVMHYYGVPLIMHYWQICNRCTGFVAMTT